MTNTFTQYSEVVDGILSGYKEVKGIRFLRNMCLVGIIATVAPGLGFHLLFPDAVELFWDRVLLVVLCGAAYFWGGTERVDIRRYSNFVYVLFYLYGLHTMMLISLNEFHAAYVIISLISIQMIALSFRFLRDAYIYIGIQFFVFIFLVAYSPRLDFEQSLLSVFVSAVCISCSALFVRFKTDFVERLKLNRDLLLALVNKTESAVFITDTQGYILECNARALEMFHQPREGFIGHDFRILRAHQLTEDEIIYGLNELEKENFWNSETELRRFDGTVFHAFVSIAMIQRKDQRFFVYRVRDISHEKQFELELFAAKEKAEEAAAARSQFLATMSHEIRTPLNGVIGMTSLLDQTVLDHRQKEYVDTIQKSGQSLMILINDILDYSKMESGRLALREEETHLPDSVYEVCDLLRPHAEMKGIRLDVQVDSRIPRWLRTDDSRLKQVLLNLVGNAIKFTHQGSIMVSCNMLSIFHDRVCIRFEVKDTGIGIPKERQSALFQPFSQINHDGSRKYGGTGLGLAISRQIVELLGGQMNLESDAGKGAVFSFDLQFDVVAIGERRAETRGSEAHILRKLEQARDMNILIAEDNLINQNVLLYMLETLGLKADVVSNGKEAIRQLSQKRYGMLFLDVQMPEMDGLLTAAWIRAHSKYQPYIICMTANSSEEDRSKSTEAGMDDFIPKPFDLNRIREALLHALSSHTDKSEKAA
ncbi:MAG: ATP-binding protein [Flavobacteriales bacterium]